MDQSERFKDQVAIVTGAGRGIGAAIAFRLASEGARVAVVDITADRAAPGADAINGVFPERAVPYAVDVTDHAATQALAGRVAADMGGRIDILVNNAGITRDALLLRMTEPDWDAVLAVNLKGAFNCTAAVLRTMVKQRAGRVVNISSTSGLMGNRGQSNYAASKAGLIGFTKSVAREIATRGITVNAVAPGFIVTDMTGALPEAVRTAILGQIPQERFGEPADVVAAVAFFASPEARYITGQVIAVDGGLAM